MVIKIKIKKNELGEFEVQWLEDGKKNEAKTYYTDDYDDAIITRNAMKREQLKSVCHGCGTKRPDDGAFYCSTCGCKLETVPS